MMMHIKLNDKRVAESTVLVARRVRKNFCSLEVLKGNRS